jgi:hypothetical protein
MVIAGLAEDTPQYRDLVLNNLISGAQVIFKENDL